MVAALRKPKHHRLIVLHGAPGTGKTELIRHLVGKVRRRKFLYLPNSLAQELDGPRLLNVLAEHAGSVLVVEEAEQLLRPRTVHEGPSAVSGLLNLTDGLLRDFLNYIVICTFNSPLAQVDPALHRNGRLIAEYQFGPLPVPQVAAIAHQHNLDLQPTTPMTLVDIFRAPALRHRMPAKTRVGFVSAGQGL